MLLSKQNYKEMLQIQFASRFSYNCSELLFSFCWLFCIGSAFCVFIDDKSDSCNLSIVTPFVFDVLAAIAQALAVFFLNKGSSLRALFDDLLFEFINNYGVKEKEYVLSIVNLFSKKAKLQMNNTGDDNPPGVKNWYDLSPDTSHLQSVFECQKANKWWDDKLTKRKILFTILFALIVLVTFSVLSYFSEKSFCQIVFCSAGIILKLIERIYANFKYYKKSVQINTLIENMENNLTEANILNLQAKINERRSMPVLGKNFIHKKASKKLGPLYSSIKGEK